ncbi:homeobox protein 12-like isoform X2 [Prorops nasuta]|uniref:homeobox protein 12-like isoform X2 n=1 Tax=Prorops nasuta TaxID=863751 RepID=UPI0034CE8164
MKLSIVVVVFLVAIGAKAHPGLLRIPKVYNAVITSNQNLEPSRAYPVIQPVIHRTTFGYVPPLYYSHLTPHFAGPEIVHLPPDARPTTEAPAVTQEESNREETTPSSNSARLEESDPDESKDTRKNNGNANGNGNGNGKNGNNGNNGEQPPLAFYPNYHSLYYDPYFYTYNTFNPHLSPSSYYIDYQPYGPLAPLPPLPPHKYGFSGHLLPSFYDEKWYKNGNGNGNGNEKVPDVPPPPLPTSAPTKAEEP